MLCFRVYVSMIISLCFWFTLGGFIYSYFYCTVCLFDYYLGVGYKICWLCLLVFAFVVTCLLVFRFGFGFGVCGFACFRLGLMVFV